MRCKARRGEENEEPVLLCSTGGVTPDIFVEMMLSKLERERARSGGQLALCSHLSVIRLPKHASICQIELKAHSGHGNSEFPFFLANEVARTQERRGHSKGLGTEKPFYSEDSFFLKRQTALTVRWRLFLHFKIFPLDFFSPLPLVVLRHVVKQSYLSLLFWEEYPEISTNDH